MYLWQTYFALEANENYKNIIYLVLLILPASEGCALSCLILLFAYKYDITHRLSQHLAALSGNSKEQGKRDNGDRGLGGNPAEDDPMLAAFRARV